MTYAMRGTHGVVRRALTMLFGRRGDTSGASGDQGAASFRPSVRWLPILLLAFVAEPALAQRPEPSALTVSLLGTGSPIPVLTRFGPSILVEAGGETLLFDVGRGVPIRLWQLGISMRKVSTVFLTHLHSDHVSGFPDLWLTGLLPPPFAGRTGAMQVFGPTGTTEMMTNLERAYQADLRIRIADEHIPPAATHIAATDIVEGVVFRKNGVTVTAFDVDHGTLIKPALGYRIDYAGHSVVLSGDTRVSENLIRFAKGADVLFHEVAAARPENLARSEAARRIIDHHTTPAEAAAVFTRVAPRLAVYTHIVLLTTAPDIPPPTIEDVEAATRSSYRGRLVMGEDLMQFTVGDSIDVKRRSATKP
ncbi:MAG: MBL fold metallo-hydrolase [Gemmatimonadaceae bacterium]